MNIKIQRTIFSPSQDKRIDESEPRDEYDDHKKLSEQEKAKMAKIASLKKQLRQILNYKQNFQFKENLILLKNRKILEGFSEEISPQVQQCFYFFSQALANARSLRSLDISGMDLHPLLAIEIGQGLQHNSSLRELNLGGCKMNSFCLQYIFSSVTNHKTLQSLNFYNNQGFTIELMNDFSQFIFKGKNHIKRIKLTHCNISNTAMSYLLRNIKYSESISQLDISMMHFNTEVLTSLGIALEHYKGKHVLESLNVSGNYIRDDGLETLSQRVNWNLRRINLRELILRRNFFTQAGIPYLEIFLRNVAQLQKLDLSQNQIEEFVCQELLARKMYEINLSNNIISVFPPFFFMNTLVVNLSNNHISSQGAFQLSSILRQNPLWIELNLSNNSLKSEGFNSIIFGLRDNKMLKKLIVANNDLDGEAIICYMINHEQVYFEYLDISWNQIRQQLIFVLLNFIKSGCLKCLRCSYLQGEDDVKKIDHNLFFLRLDDYQLKQNNQVFQLTSFNLSELDFHGNKDIFTTVVYSLSTYFNKIEKLNLSSCSPIIDTDIEQLCQFLRKSTVIRDLNLSNLNLGGLSNECIKKLSDALQISSLKYLNLSMNRLYKQIKRLFSVKQQGLNFRLEILDISQNCLEGKHTQYIEKLLTTFRNLQDINLSRNCLSFESLIAINRALQINRSIMRINLSYQKLSADDLLILSQTLGTEGLQELNLANNPYTSRMKTFFNQCSTQRQDFLNFSHVYFDDANQQSLMTTIKNQKRNLQGITLESCIFKNNNYIAFSNQLYKCRNLQYFAMIYNPTIDRELGGVIEKIPKFRQLKILRMNQVSLTGTYVQGLSEFLSVENCSLHTFDMSQNRLTQAMLDKIAEGVSLNTTLKTLMLNECNLGQLKLKQLGIAIASNPVLEILEIARNKIICFRDFLEECKTQDSVSMLTDLNISENPLNDNCIVGLFLPVKSEITLKPLRINYLNLTNCHLQSKLFSMILEAQLNYQQEFSFSNILSLCLCNNKLQDDVGSILKEIIINNHSLRELQLQNNQLSSQGCLEIMQGILLNETVRSLDIQSNEVDDQFVFQIAPKLMIQQLKNLEFILLRNNNFTRTGLKKLVEITRFQDKLFIDNIWSELDDDDAEIILKQYTKVRQAYRLEQNLIPNFLKEIQIQRSNLTDKFCEALAHYYPLLPQIEFIDISDNEYITMYGKVYLFIHLFDQSYGKHCLRAMYITDSQETRKLFDDGLLRYLLLRFRNFLYPPKQFAIKSVVSQREVFRSSQTQMDGKAVVQKIIGGLCGAWILHKINKLMTYLDQIEPPQFIVSTLFIGKFRTNNINIKSLSVFLWIASIFINIMPFIKIVFARMVTTKETHQRFIEQCNDINLSDKCLNFGIDVSFGELQLFFIILGVLVGLEIFQLVISIYIRRKIQPAFQIVHPTMLKYLHSSYPHQREIFLMVQSILNKLSVFPEKLLLYYALSLSMDDLELSNLRISFKGILIMLSIIIVLRQVDYFFMLLWNNIKFLRITPKFDQAKYLQLLQSKMYYEGYYILSDILVALCPRQGYRLTKAVVINEEIIVELYRIVLFELTAIIVFSFFYSEYRHLIKDKFRGQDPYGLTQGWIIVAIVKSILFIIMSLFRILTVRPAVVKQHGFNQALAIKKFYENKQQFVIPAHINIKYEPEQLIQPKVAKPDKNLQKLKTERQGSYDIEMKVDLQRSKMDEIQEEESVDEQINQQDEEQSILHSEHSVDYETPAGQPLSLGQPKFKYVI